MKIKSNLIKILILCIIMFLFIGTNQSIAAGGTVNIKSLYDTCTIDSKTCNVFCVQREKHLNPGNYTIGNKYEVNGKDVYLNGTKLDSESDEYKKALKTAYVLSNEDTAQEISETTISNKLTGYSSLPAAAKESVKRAIDISVYYLTSVNQNAIWKIRGQGTYWVNENALELGWDADGDGDTEKFRIEKNGLYYNYKSGTGYISGGAYEGIVNINIRKWGY